MAKSKKEKFTSPKGRAKFPWLNQPDTRFDDNGVYRTSLILTPDDPQAQKFIEWLDEQADKAVEKAKNDLIENKKKADAKKVVRAEPYSMETDQEGEETGNFEVRFKLKAKVYSKKHEKWFNFHPDLFDAKGNKISSDVRITGGSLIRVSFIMRDYYMPATKNAGVTMELKAVQVIELASGGASASYYGFDEEEGFDVKEDGHETEAETEGSDEDTSDEEEEEDGADIDF